MSDPRKRQRTRGTGTLFQKVNGKGQTNRYWHIQYFKNDPATGKRIRIREATGLTSRPDAEKFLRTRLGQIDRGELFDVKRVEAVRVEDLFTLLVQDKKDNAASPKALRDLDTKLKLHLRPFFGTMVAANVTTDHINNYKKKRLEEHSAARATINHELAELRRAFNLGKRATPPKVRSAPHFAMFKENNTRTNFVEYEDFIRMREKAKEPWLRLFIELAFHIAWRSDAELIALRVRHVNLPDGKLRLDPAMAKNDQGREVMLPRHIREMMALACAGKKPNDSLFTRSNGKPVKDFRRSWENLCVDAKMPGPDGEPSAFFCRKCGAPWGDAKCTGCSNLITKQRIYKGLLRHDMRRSGAKFLRKLGIPESTIMQPAGWKTASMFRRYAIYSEEDQRMVADKLEQAQQALVPPRSRQAENAELGTAVPASLKVQ